MIFMNQLQGEQIVVCMRKQREVGKEWTTVKMGFMITALKVRKIKRHQLSVLLHMIMYEAYTYNQM